MRAQNDRMGKSRGQNISITPELLAHAKKQVESGRFENISEYMRSLVRKDQERQVYGDKLRALIDDGLSSGDDIDMTPSQLGRLLKDHIKKLRKDQTMKTKAKKKAG